MTTGPNEILLKRSDTASRVPGHTAISFGEVAINASDGKMFFREQTGGTTTGDVWTVAGSTNENFVISVNGETGAVTVEPGGVTSFAGFTGAVAEGVTTNQILFHNGLGITGSEDFTFDGTDVVLGGQGHFDGAMIGPQQKKIRADEALAAGDPVYITGNIGASDRVTVAKADASDSAKMPAAGIVSTAFSTNQEGHMTIGGSIDQFNTAGYTSNDELYVSPGGGLTLERPSSGSDLVQKVVRVGRVDASTGTIIVTGANRANDVPNLLHARAGISCDGGVTVEGELAANEWHAKDHGGFIRFDGGGGGGIDFYPQSGAKYLEMGFPDGVKSYQPITVNISSADQFVASSTKVQAKPVLIAQAGISLEAAGITFSDGTFQSTAASSAEAGAGITVNGSTVGIDPDAHIKAAGISVAGATVAGTLNVSEIYDYDQGNDTGLDLSVNHTITLKTGGQQRMRILGTSIENKVALKAEDIIIASAGISMNAAGITFADGTFQSTAASGGGGGGATMSIGFIIDGQGAALTTGEKIDALKQIPYDCQVLNTSAFVADGVSGPTNTVVFGIKKTATLSNSITGVTLEIGSTGSTDQTGFTFDGINGGIYFRELDNVANAAGSTINANEWIYPDITGNSGDINKIQIFMTVIPT
jgi:hypothetical protein